ncbi:MAG: CvpA family protein [bacterium]|nr:CvpA family protein [bacterium]
MNVFDIALLVLACVLVVLGMVKGLVRILIGLAALIAAFALAARFHRPLANQLSGFDISDAVLGVAAYLAIFLGVMIAGGFITYWTRKLVKAAMLSWADRLAGAALGFAAAALLAAMVLLPLVAYVPQSDRLLRQSVLAPYVTVVADLANTIVPDELSEEYRRRVDDLRRQWQDQMLDEIESEPSRV